MDDLSRGRESMISESSESFVSDEMSEEQALVNAVNAKRSGVSIVFIFM